MMGKRAKFLILTILMVLASITNLTFQPVHSQPSIQIIAYYPERVYQGDLFTFSVYASNTGSKDAEDPNIYIYSVSPGNIWIVGSSHLNWSGRKIIKDGQFYYLGDFSLQVYSYAVPGTYTIKVEVFYKWFDDSTEHEGFSMRLFNVQVLSRKPNLTLQVSLSSDSALPGETLMVSGEIYNSGAEKAEFTWLELWFDEDFLYSVSIGEIKSNSTKSFNLSFKVPESVAEGLHSVKVKVSCTEGSTDTRIIPLTVKVPETIAEFISHSYVVVVGTETDADIALSVLPIREVLLNLTDKGRTLLLGGPIANNYVRDKCMSLGIKFTDQNMTFKGQTYWSRWGRTDHCIIILTGKYLLVMGTHRYGTKAGLLYITNHEVKTDTLIIRWFDFNTDGKVQLEELIKIPS